MLAKKMEETKASCWLVNTGWVGGKFGTGSRCPLRYTRAIINAIHSSAPPDEFVDYDVFGLKIPTHIEGVPDQVLDPKKAWEDGEAFEKERKRLANMFVKAFRTFEDHVDEDVKQAGPSSILA
jgi:phosphoenolpyruvate carboxykinase (ATP)